MTLWSLGSALSLAALGYSLNAGLVPLGSSLADMAWLALALATTAAIGIFESGR